MLLSLSITNVLCVLLVLVPFVHSAERAENIKHVTTRWDHEKRRLTCTVLPLGAGKDDAPNIMAAAAKCGNGGTIVFPPSQTYLLAQKLHLSLKNAILNWYGTLTILPSPTYWRQPGNLFPIAFQNHSAALIISGSDIVVDNGGTGGINGSGETWYNLEHGSTQWGRPMPIVWWNVTRVSVRGFRVVQPALWGFNVMGARDMDIRDLYVNATASKAGFSDNWVQNTDGFDTMDVNNLTLKNLVYQGGDDCIAIKPRSYNVFVQNVTCVGGNGIAIGSLGQYLEDSSVVNVTIKDAHVMPHNADIPNGAYIKTWVGALVSQGSSYESGGVPRGNGTGVVENVRFENFWLEGASTAAAITQDSGNNGCCGGTSNMQISGIKFLNFHGFLSSGSKKDVSINCSRKHPCYDIQFAGWNLTGTGKNTCAGVKPGGVVGITGSGC